MAHWNPFTRRVRTEDLPPTPPPAPTLTIEQVRILIEASGKTTWAEVVDGARATAEHLADTGKDLQVRAGEKQAEAERQHDEAIRLANEKLEAELAETNDLAVQGQNATTHASQILNILTII